MVGADKGSCLVGIQRSVDDLLSYCLAFYDLCWWDMESNHCNPGGNQRLGAEIQFVQGSRCSNNTFCLRPIANAQKAKRQEKSHRSIL